MITENHLCEITLVFLSNHKNLKIIDLVTPKYLNLNFLQSDIRSSLPLNVKTFFVLI